MSKDSHTSMKNAPEPSSSSTSSTSSSSNQPIVMKSALKSIIKQQQHQHPTDQREDSSCDGNSIATPTGSLPQPRAVRFSPGVSSTTTGTSVEDTIPDLPPLPGTRQPLGRRARQAQVRKLLQLASQSSRDTESGSLPIPSKTSKFL